MELEISSVIYFRSLRKVIRRGDNYLLFFGSRVIYKVFAEKPVGNYRKVKCLIPAEFKKKKNLCTLKLGFFKTIFYYYSK
jgi:hypothetical protein